MSINKTLAEAILKSKISISRIAEKSGISRQHIYQIMNGKKNVSSLTLEKICDAINISPASLYNEDYHIIQPIRETPPPPSNKNTISIIGRGGGKKDIVLDDAQFNAIKTILENIAKENEDEDF